MVQDTSLKTRGRHYVKSSSFLMALLFTILCGAVALSLGYFINFSVKGHFVHSAQAVIDSEIKYIEALGDIPVSNENTLYIPLDEDAHLPEGFPKPDKILTEGLLVFHMPDLHRRYAARIHTFDNREKLLIGTDITSMAKDFNFMQWIGLTSIAFVMIVVFVSYLISVFVVNGTNKIADTAYDIIRTGDLSQRVDVNSRWDDLSNVATVLNLLLERIEGLMFGVRQVSDNIAHDLRTPLTRMRSHIEGLQKQSPDNTDYIKLLAEADRVLGTFSALLRISRIETEQQRSQFKNLDLDKIVKDVIDFYEPLAEEKGVAVQIQLEPVSFYGDRDLLFQAFANILDNAVKYTPAHGAVRITLQKKPRNIVVTIENTGDSIPEDDLPKIFERFYRADKSRSEPGTGLGLSLVSAVISLHGGNIYAKNADTGFQIITHL